MKNTWFGRASLADHYRHKDAKVIEPDDLWALTQIKWVLIGGKYKPDYQKTNPNFMGSTGKAEFDKGVHHFCNYLEDSTIRETIYSAPEALEEVIKSSKGFVLGEYNVEIAREDDWIMFEQRDYKTFFTHRNVRARGDQQCEGSAEFRIPILITAENMDKAYKVMHKFWQNPPNDVKLPKVAKLYNVAKLLDERPDMVNPELGPFTDQRGKGLCFYVTWEKKGGVSLTADEYKNFILNMLKALHEGGVEGIGYYASIGPDKAFKKAKDVPTLPVFASYLDYVTHVRIQGEQKVLQGDEALFAFEPEFRAAKFPNPLHDIVITQKDLDSAGLTKKILLDIENEHKKYILRDFPKRIEKLNDYIKYGIPDIEKYDLIEKGEGSKLPLHYNALKDKCKGLFDLEPLPSSAKDALTLLRLSNACKHLTVEANEFVRIAAPLIKKILDGYKTNDADLFAFNVLSAVKEVYPNLSEEKELTITASAKDKFYYIKDRISENKEKMGIVSAIFDFFMWLFGYGMEYEASRAGSAYSFVNILREQEKLRNTQEK